MTHADLDRFAARASTLLKVMSNPHRLLMLHHLAQGEMSVGQLETVIGLSQSALSQHLAKLRRCALVRTRRERQNIYYTLNGEASQTVINALQVICRDAPSAEHAGHHHEAHTHESAGSDLALQA